MVPNELTLSVFEQLKLDFDVDHSLDGDESIELGEYEIDTLQQIVDTGAENGFKGFTTNSEMSEFYKKNIYTLHYLILHKSLKNCMDAVKFLKKHDFDMLSAYTLDDIRDVLLVPFKEGRDWEDTVHNVICLHALESVAKEWT